MAPHLDDFIAPGTVVFAAEVEQPGPTMVRTALGGGDRASTSLAGHGGIGWHERPLACIVRVDRQTRHRRWDSDGLAGRRVSVYSGGVLALWRVAVSGSIQSDVLSVAALELQHVLAAEIGPVRVQGEVSQFTAARSGHWYFTLKDAEASISAVMFRGSNRYCRVRPAVGDVVVVSGALDLYAPRGQLNLVVRRMAAAGEGDLQARIEATKRKLAAEGLFDPSRKRPLPALPTAIGVATSPTGAAFQDILRVTGERFPGIPILLAPCRVQGAEAPAEVVAALELLKADGRASVVIVGRGGGSAEDLMAFNDEQVARAIAAMPMPVVSAVGHETDVSIADLVADLRAATPSHAAEMVVPDRTSMMLAVDDLGLRVHQALRRRLARARERLSLIRIPPPSVAILRNRQRVERAGDRLQEAMDRSVRERRTRLATLGGQLHALSPRKVLERGFAIVRGPDGTVLSRVQGAGAGDLLRVEVQDGAWMARVESTEPSA